MICLNHQFVAISKRALRSLTILVSVLLVLNACNDEPKTKDGDKENTDTTKVDTVVPPKGVLDTSVVTVAAIRRVADGKTVQFLFNEKQQIFTINTGDQSYTQLNQSFEESLKSRDPIKIITDITHGTIVSVAKPSANELETFRIIYKEVLKSASPLRIDVLKIDTSKFNIIDSLHFPVWRFCSKVVPDYTTAKAIFDFCAQQSCHLPGPYSINHCIPFQYVIDGCYARAHKMRSIIEKNYGYCSEKVFSFANVEPDHLAVKASKWGGCCVGWWYHVAPVIRVRIKLYLNNTRAISIVLAYVIDPGMFDQPVLLSTWLQAQKNQSCDPNANVSAFTIQPSSAYSPANYSGTLFTTDPSYTATDATLVNYKNKITCP